MSEGVAAANPAGVVEIHLGRVSGVPTNAQASKFQSFTAGKSIYNLLGIENGRLGVHAHVGQKQGSSRCREVNDPGAAKVCGEGRRDRVMGRPY